MSSVDVVVPCYRYGRFLRGCVDSVLSQEGCDVRVLIIDDASADGSAKIARAAAVEDRRVAVRIHERNEGMAAVCNEGIEWAEAEYFLTLSADDLLTPGALARATNIMTELPEVSFTYGTELILDSGGTTPIVAPDPHVNWWISSGSAFIRHVCSTGRNHVGTSTAVVRTSAQKAVGGYRPELPHTSDMEMWLRLAMQGAVAYTDVAQGIRRVHGANMSTTRFGRRSLDYIERETALKSFFANEGRSIDGHDALLYQARRQLSQGAYWSALRRLRYGEIACASELLAFCYRLQPGNVLLPPIGHLLRRGTHPRSKCDLIWWDTFGGVYRRTRSTVRTSTARP